MTLLIIFVHALRGAPRLAIEGLYWLIRRRRVRGWNMLYRAAMASPGYYGMWVRYCEPRHFDDLCPAEDAPLSHIHALILPNPDKGLRDAQASADSLRLALGDGVTIHMPAEERPGPIQPWLAGLADADGHAWLLPVIAGDRLSPRFARIVADKAAGEASIRYWDEDGLDPRGRRHTPFLKPDWDPLLFLSRDTLGGASMIRLDAALAACARLDSDSPMSGAAVSTILTVAAGARGVPPPHHSPMILVHRAPGSALTDLVARKAILETAWPEPVELYHKPLPPHHLAVRFPLPADAPSVSIVIATRDRVDLLQCCVDGVLANTYPGRTEIIIVDNDSVEVETLAYFDRIRGQGVRILHQAGAFNYSAINNRAVREATGTFICLLNNDIEMLDTDWLTAMMRHAARPGVGAVGALLLYPDRTVQHAGVAIGVGNAAGHVHRKVPLDAMGHHGLHRTTRRASVVTAACLVVRRESFLAVGGLDEENFKVAFNDVDLCLKLAAAGLRNIFVAEAMLIHHESKSRGDDMLKENFERYSQELAWLQSKWSTPTVVDPYHHPLWLRSSEQCALRP